MKKLLIVLNVVAVLCILKYASFLFLWKLPQELELIAFDIGQGDSLMLTVPNSSIQILIDGGPDDKVVEKLQKYLPAGDNFVDVIILTHGHDDHVGGLPSVIENFEVGLVIDTGAVCDNTNYQKMVEQIELLSLPKLYAVRGEKIRIGSDFILEIIHPFFSQNVEYKNLNDASITATISYQEKKIVLTGDFDTVLGQWRGEQHLNYSDSPAVDKQAFLKAIARVLRNEISPRGISDHPTALS